MANSVTIKITSCLQCPHVRRGSEYSLDGWDRGYDCFCTKIEKEKEIQSFVEWRDKVSIPKWCPAKVK